MTEETLLYIARLIGIIGLSLLIVSGFGGVLLASRTAQRRKLLKGRTFTWHRRVSLIGASLFLLHPVPILFAKKTTGGLSLINVFVPFTAPRQSLWIGLGVVAAYALIIVTLSSLYIKRVKRERWRALHYGTYLVFALGLIHGLFISAEFRAGEGAVLERNSPPAVSMQQARQIREAKTELIDLEEPEKIILLVLAVVTVAFPVHRAIIAWRTRPIKPASAVVLLLCLLSFSVSAAMAQEPHENLKPAPVKRTEASTMPPPAKLSGNMLLTGNVSTLGRPLPSLNAKLTLDFALPRAQILDLRVESYFDGSFNENPPGQLLRNINEHKLEEQLTYTYPLTSVFALSGGVLHHENFTFRDTYEWGIFILTAKIPLGRQITLTPNISAEKRFKGGRWFYDTATTLDYAIPKNWTFETSYHLYENFGESDPAPTHKQEFEIGFIRQLPHNQTVALSYFRHIQFGAPNDQFSFVKLKYGVSF